MSKEITSEEFIASVPGMKEAMAIPPCKFEIDEIVCKPAFTDCFGKLQPRIELLRVVERRLIDTKERAEFKMKPYWRIKATTDANGFGWFEGAERYFQKLGGF